MSAILINAPVDILPFRSESNPVRSIRPFKFSDALVMHLDTTRAMMYHFHDMMGLRRTCSLRVGYLGYYTFLFR